VIMSFIKRYLLSWKGRENRGQILDLMEYLPLGSFDQIRKDFLEPLENAILDHFSTSRVAIIDFYSSLIRQWGTVTRTQASVAPEGCAPLIALITHTELFALSALEFPVITNDGNANQSKPINLSVLQLYSTLADLFSHAAGNGNIRLTLPLAPTIYTLAFTPTTAHISLLCSVLAIYKSSFEASLISETLKSSLSLYSPQIVGQFNGYVMDICNLLWRNRGMNTDDPNAVGCLMPSSIVAVLTEYTSDVNETTRNRKRSDGFHYNFPAIFSLSQHIALCSGSAACFAEIEDKLADEGQARLGKPVTQKGLAALEKEGGVKFTWQEYRLKMLDWMDERGSQGIGKLMRSTMKALRREG
jgi:centromere protein I